MTQREDKDKRRYRKLYVRIWRTPAFRGLPRDAKLAALYLLTGPQTNRLGCYALSPALAAEDLDLSPAVFQKQFKVVCEAFLWTWDASVRVLYIPSWWEWNPPANPKALIGALTDAIEVPPCALLDTCTDTLSNTFPEWYPKVTRKGIAYQEQEQEQEKEQEQDQQQEQGPPAAPRVPPKLITRQNPRIVNPGAVVECWDFTFRDLMALAAAKWPDEGERRKHLWTWLDVVDADLRVTKTVPREEAKVFWPKRFREEFGTETAVVQGTGKTTGNASALRAFVANGG